MKTQKQLLLTGVLLAGGLLSQPVLAGGIIDRATMLANTCAPCHGPNGVSNGPATPSIAGMSENKIIETLNGFKNGTRPSTVMQRIAKGYSDDDIKALASYFSALDDSGK